MSRETEELLLVGFDGESLSLFRQRQADGGWTYGIRANSSLLDMLDDEEAAECRSAQEASAKILYPTFEAAMLHINPCYVHGTPIHVHPEFRNDIWAAYCRTVEKLALEQPDSIQRSNEKWQDAWSEMDRFQTDDQEQSVKPPK